MRAQGSASKAELPLTLLLGSISPPAPLPIMHPTSSPVAQLSVPLTKSHTTIGSSCNPVRHPVTASMGATAEPVGFP